MLDRLSNISGERWRSAAGVVGGIVFFSIAGFVWNWQSIDAKCIRGDCENGAGILAYDSGMTYVGEFKQDRRHGLGKLTAPGGHRYTGHWLDDQKHGYGRYQYPNGAVYTGEFKNDRRHGLGKLLFSGGTAYEGRWQDDQLHGSVTTTLANGQELKGVYESGRIQSGAGVEIGSDGVLRIGRWQDGEALSGGVRIPVDEIPPPSLNPKALAESGGADSLP